MRFMQIGDSVPIVWPGDEYLPEPERRPCSARILTGKQCVQLAAARAAMQADAADWQAKVTAVLGDALAQVPPDAELAPLGVLDLIARIEAAQYPSGADTKKSASPSPGGTATS